MASFFFGILISLTTIPYFIEDGKGVPGFVQTDRELAVKAFEAWSRDSGGTLKFVEVKSPDAALIRLRWVSAREGLFGETQYIQVGDKRGAIVNVIPDVSELGESLAMRAARDRLFRDTVVYLTCVHELGHAIGLQHTQKFQDIMYYFGYGGDIVAYFMRYRDQLKSRDDIVRFSGLSAGDVAVLKQLFH